MLTLRRSVKQLEESAKEPSQVAVSSADTKLIATIAKLNGELAKAKAENSSQQGVFSRKIEDMSRKKDEELLEYSAQVNTLHAELLRREGYCSQENLPYQSAATSIPKREVSIAEAQNVSDPNPKREVSVASSDLSISPGTTQVILTAIQRMEQRISGLADRVDKPDERNSIT